jgi:formamidopyrimidine-DNA glycosylase
MPELPEVETIRRFLVPHLTGQRLVQVRVLKPRMLLGGTPKDLTSILTGQEIIALARRGKYLVLEMNKSSLIIHLGMTGQLNFSSKENHRGEAKKPKGRIIAGKHVHMIASFKGGETLRFRDVRTFGKIIFIPGSNWKEHPRIMRLGPEPLELTPTSFLRKRLPLNGKRGIKSLLLDQSFICGLGNIYCDEALFSAGINPEQPVNTLTSEQWLLLLKVIKMTLRKGIKNFGTTFSDYRKPDGSFGTNGEKLFVYGRGGQACIHCGGILEKTVVAQRGTVVCPHCQPLRR